MADYRAKFDSELRDIHTSFVDLQRGNRERVYPHHSKAVRSVPLSLLLQFSDDLAGIEARGFRTEWVEGNFARGDVDLADLEAVASHPMVIQLAYGGGYQPLLDTSVEEITARENAQVPGVWKVDTTTGVFGGSRDMSLLQGNVTYGVEYTEQMINDFLQKKPGAKKVKHKDCYGHGTHVASIAAGDGRATHKKKQWEFVGVAPEADLIIVKLFFPQVEPPVDESRRFEDAVTYIERVAKTPDLKDRPVVINASLGENLGPHDGLVAWDQLLETRYKGAARKAFVAAAGNDGGERQHGVIVIPSTGKVDVPFTFYDERR